MTREPLPSRAVLQVRTREALNQLHPLARLIQAGMTQDVLAGTFTICQEIGKKSLKRLGNLARNARRNERRAANQAQYLLEHRGLDSALSYLQVVRATTWLIGYIKHLEGAEFPGTPAQVITYLERHPIDDINAPFVLANLIVARKAFLSHKGELLASNRGAIVIRTGQSCHSEIPVTDDGSSLRVTISNINSLRSFIVLGDLFVEGLRPSVAETLLPFASSRFIRRLYKLCSNPDEEPPTGSLPSSPAAMFRDPNNRLAAVSIIRAFAPDQEEGGGEGVYVMDPHTLMRAWRRYVRLCDAAGIPASLRLDINTAWSILRSYWTQTHPLAIVRRECDHTHLLAVSQRQVRLRCPVCEAINPALSEGLVGRNIGSVGQEAHRVRVA